mmetsp:Transcript_32056/g.47161  ORF Transcript_32056/g.47161 Transcript_32056/m.47161 type:complete len:208 (+) Transcript_32056:185-808(+)
MRLSSIIVVAQILLCFVPSIYAQSSSIIDWTFQSGTSLAKVTIDEGDSVTFDWASSFHNVLKFTSLSEFQGCDFSGADNVASGSPSGSETVTFNKSGDYYYGCSIGAHCTNGGMKVHIEVKGSSPAPTEPAQGKTQLIPKRKCVRGKVQKKANNVSLEECQMMAEDDNRVKGFQFKAGKRGKCLLFADEVQPAADKAKRFTCGTISQ